MTLPTTFAALTSATGQQLDNNFNALGKLPRVPGTISGTNALTLALLTNTPVVAALSNYMAFVSVAAATNTAAATLAIGSISALSVYKDTEAGPVLLTGGEIVANNCYAFIYDAALASGAGGFHLQSLGVILTAQATVTFTNLAANSSQDQSVTFANAVVGDIVQLGPPVSIATGVSYMGYVPAAGTVNVRAINSTAASLTPTGGTFRIGLRGAA